MGRPTGVGNSQKRRRNRLLSDQGFKLTDLALFLADNNTRLAGRNKRNPAGVVTAIFEVLQAFKKKPERFAFADIADDSAHGRTP